MASGLPGNGNRPVFSIITEPFKNPLGHVLLPFVTSSGDKCQTGMVNAVFSLKFVYPHAVKGMRDQLTGLSILKRGVFEIIVWRIRNDEFYDGQTNHLHASLKGHFGEK